MRLRNKILTILTIMFVTFVSIASVTQVHALTACDFFPCSTNTNNPNVPDSERNILDPNFDVATLIRWILGTAFTAILAWGVFIIIRGAILITKSEGNEEQIQKGVAFMKGVYIGILMIILGLVGLVLVFVLTDVPASQGGQEGIDILQEDLDNGGNDTLINNLRDTINKYL